MEPVTDNPQSQTQASGQSVPMISSDYSMTKMVPIEQADALKQQGWDHAVKMVGPQGEKKWTPQGKVAEMRTHDFMVTPEYGQAMRTPDGKVTYALPSEVRQFEQSGHRKIDASGNTQFTNQEIEEAKFIGITPEQYIHRVASQQLASDQQVNDRSTALMKAIPDSAKQLLETDEKIERGMQGATMIAGGTLAGVTGYQTGVAVAGSPMGQQIIKEGGKYVAKKLLPKAAAGAGAAAAYKWLTGK